MTKIPLFDSPFRVTSGYRTAARPNHMGIDYGTGIGTYAWDIAGGGIINNWEDAIGGKIASITWNSIGLRIQIHHCSEFLFPSGHVTAKDSVWCRTGNTGNSTAPHAHVEAWIEAENINGVITKKGKNVDPDSVYPLIERLAKPNNQTQQLIAEIDAVLAKYRK